MSAKQRPNLRATRVQVNFIYKGQILRGKILSRNKNPPSKSFAIGIQNRIFLLTFLYEPHQMRPLIHYRLQQPFLTLAMKKTFTARWRLRHVGINNTGMETNCNWALGYVLQVCSAMSQLLQQLSQGWRSLAHDDATYYIAASAFDCLVATLAYDAIRRTASLWDPIDLQKDPLELPAPVL